MSERSIVIITGASRGIGKQIAVQAAKLAGPNSVFLLTARNAESLENLKKLFTTSTVPLIVDTIVCDMERYDEAEEKFTNTIKGYSENGQFDKLLLFHNVGTVGSVSKRADELSDSLDWHTFLDVNLVSNIRFNNLVLSLITEKVAKKRFVVDITSLAAIKGFPSFTQYSVGKAAREAFFRGLCVETPSIKVLHYSPGPVDTDMHTQVANETFDESIRDAFTSKSTSDVNRATLTPEQTVTRLMKIIQHDSFKSGDRIDYFDKE